MTGALIIQFLVKDNFNRQEVKKKAKVKLSFAQIFTSPAVVAILSLFIFMGMSRRIGQPFVAMLVEIINGNDNAAFWTGIASAFAAGGGVFAGFVFGWACDNIKLSKLLAPVIIVTVIASSVQAYATNLTVLMIAQFISYFAGGGLQPILLMWLSRITNPELKGSYFGFSGSINVFGGILSSLLSGWIVLQFDVRSIFLTSGLLALIMLPIMFIAKKYSAGKEDIAQ
jgi:MFS family permease